MPVRVLAVGKKHESWVQEGIQRYEKRLQRPFDVSWQLLPHSAREGDAARGEESARILDKINDGDYVILLDERGTNLDSPSLSSYILSPLQRSQAVVIIIGGAYGVDASVHQRANLIWSLSKLVFPHQLVRLILIEQIYRAQEITNGRPYHHE
jgi:23S rRNA (pseudouridine1915-N3)-methyltransferase